MSKYHKVKVKTTWGNGMMSVGSPYVWEAIKAGQGLEILCKGNSYKIPYRDLIAKAPRSGTFKDKKTGKPYQLFDFHFKEAKRG